jgi:hypothetical protein
MAFWPHLLNQRLHLLRAYACGSVWVPESADQIESAAKAGELEETPSFEVKRELPTPKKNADLAKDVAAMATDGGVLLYGIAEDDQGQPTIPVPIALAGVRERIDQIVTAGVAEVPYIDVRSYPCADDPSLGYIAVVVPQSERAPHQVIVGGDLRYYGRGATGNRVLTEGDVARLYERRQSWAVNREALLDDAISQAPYGPWRHLGYLHAFARPVAIDAALFDRATATVGSRDALQDVMSQAAAATRPNDGYSPSFKSYARWSRHGADSWRLSTAPANIDYSEASEAAYLVEADFQMDGQARLFVGRAAEREDKEFMSNRLTIYESNIAGTLAGFLAALGTLYRTAGYFGQVDLGLAVTGIKGGVTSRASPSRYFDVDAYPTDDYRRTRRAAAAELSDSEAVASSLLQPLMDAATMRDGYDPFDPP